MSLGDWFDRAKVVTSLYREADRLYYDAVAEEMQRGIRDDGLWLMAFEKAEGNETRTKAFYIGLRVQRLKEQADLQDWHLRKSKESNSINLETRCKYCHAEVEKSTVVCRSCRRVLRA